MGCIQCTGEGPSRRSRFAAWRRSHPRRAEYDRPFWSKISGFGGFDWNNEGGRLSEFEPGSPRYDLPAYSIVNLRAGLKMGSYTFAAYVRNAGDARAINSISPIPLGSVSALSASTATPRTIGVTLSATY
jgi:iron complex outermembrane recepter protein